MILISKDALKYAFKLIKSENKEILMLQSYKYIYFLNKCCFWAVYSSMNHEK